jgi:hypothetical protein
MYSDAFLRADSLACSNAVPQRDAARRYQPDVTGAIRRLVEPAWTGVDIGAHVGAIIRGQLQFAGESARLLCSQLVSRTRRTAAKTSLRRASRAT